MNNVEVKFEGMHTYAFLDGYWFYLDNFPNLGWGYTTSDINLAEKYGFKKELFDFEYFFPIKDIAHTRGFESNVYCKYKGFEFFVHSYNVCNDKLFCISPESYEAAKFFGFSDGAMRYEMPNLDVPLSDLDEIYRKRRKLDKFIFDVDPIKPIYKDGKWLIEPDENGVYVI
ncbi:hypothetical protein SAMN05216518_14618 [Bacteroidales bacterium KHT7]|nr:hypothetical protein SAMN05216518_14618 [Bacteroidales bacterium KHT7]